LFYCRLATVLLGSMLALHLPDSARADLAIEVRSSMPVCSEPAAFEMTVVVRNQGDVPLVVLPHGLRRVYDAVGSGAAVYSPYPGPPMAPWRGAFSLEPGGSRTLSFVGMSDGDGIWRIEPGRYALRARLSVTSDAARAAEAHVSHLGAAIWEGDVRSPAIHVTHEPSPAP
jgi:hypothetical protein